MEAIDFRLPHKKIIEVVGNVTSPFVVITELIKNSIDSSGNNVNVYIDDTNNSITVEDNGNGFSKETILGLGEIAESDKKQGDYLTNNSGQMLLGSKGLAIYSTFNLGEQVKINTINQSGEVYNIHWEKATGILEFEELEKKKETFNSGTTLEITGIDPFDIKMITAEKEYFKHISIDYMEKNNKIADVSVFINGDLISNQFKNLEDIVSDFDLSVEFEYINDESKVYYKFIEANQPITSDTKIFDTKINNVDKVLIEEYHLRPSINFKDYIKDYFKMNLDLPSFKGKFYVVSGRRTKDIKDFGYGVKLFINGFALYDYLASENDWLNFGDITSTKRTSRFKKHNVYGYINFYEFNDNEEGLIISNERGGFNKNAYYINLFNILYQYVVYPSINIDVALKNPKDLVIVQGEKKDPIKEICIPSNQNEELLSEDVQETKENVISDLSKANGEKKEQDEIEAAANNDEESENSKPNLLNHYKKTIDYGVQFDLLSPSLINYNVLVKKDLKIISLTSLITTIKDDYIFIANEPGIHKILFLQGNDIREELIINVKEQSRINSRKNQFFVRSEKYQAVIDIGYLHPILEQLEDLTYANKYLLFFNSFRTILEDVTKRYINKIDSLELSGDLQKNVLQIINDIEQKIVLKSKDPEKVKKENIHAKFGGYKNLNNFLKYLSSRIVDDEVIRTLHLGAHSASAYSEIFALEIANELILPFSMLMKHVEELNL